MKHMLMAGTRRMRDKAHDAAGKGISDGSELMHRTDKRDDWRVSFRMGQPAAMVRLL